MGKRVDHVLLWERSITLIIIVIHFLVSLYTRTRHQCPVKQIRLLFARPTLLTLCISITSMRRWSLSDQQRWLYRIDGIILGKAVMCCRHLCSSRCNYSLRSVDHITSTFHTFLTLIRTLIRNNFMERRNIFPRSF